MANEINAKLSKLFGFPENTTEADIIIRPMQPPEINIKYLIFDINGIPEESEGKFKLIEVDSNEN